MRQGGISVGAGEDSSISDELNELHDVRARSDTVGLGCTRSQACVCQSAARCDHS